MLEILKTFDFENIVHAGNTANMFDIFIKDEDYYRGLQIKTLVHYPADNCYVVKSNQNGYENDTLIIAVSNVKDKYVLMFYNEMKEYTRFSTTCNADKIYDNLDLFKIKLLEMVRKSTVVTNFNDYLPKPELLEAESINRFENKCDALKIPFKRNTTNSNEIDAFVNNYNVQLKSSKTYKNNIYKFGLSEEIWVIRDHTV